MSLKQLLADQQSSLAKRERAMNRYEETVAKRKDWQGWWRMDLLGGAQQATGRKRPTGLSIDPRVPQVYRKEKAELEAKKEKGELPADSTYKYDAVFQTATSAADSYFTAPQGGDCESSSPVPPMFVDIHFEQSDDGDVVAHWFSCGELYRATGKLSQSKAVLEGARVHRVKALHGGTATPSNATHVHSPTSPTDRGEDELSFRSPLTMKLGSNANSITGSFDWQYLYPKGSRPFTMTRQPPKVIALHIFRQGLSSPTIQPQPPSSQAPLPAGGVGPAASSPLASLAVAQSQSETSFRDSDLGGFQSSLRTYPLELKALPGVGRPGSAVSSSTGKTESTSVSQQHRRTQAALEPEDEEQYNDLGFGGEVRTRRFILQDTAPAWLMAKEVVEMDAKKRDRIELAPISSTATYPTHSSFYPNPSRVRDKDSMRALLNKGAVASHWCEGGPYNNDDYYCVLKSDLDRLTTVSGKFYVLPTTVKGLAQLKHQHVHFLQVNVELAPTPAGSAGETDAVQGVPEATLQNQEKENPTLMMDKFLEPTRSGDVPSLAGTFSSVQSAAKALLEYLDSL
jgi:hypothetical protein